jgi:hypothetical protein
LKQKRTQHAQVGGGLLSLLNVLALLSVTATLPRVPTHRNVIFGPLNPQNVERLDL